MLILAFGPEWTGPDYLIAHFGLIGILATIFAESGLFAFLPGDSLLFTAGLLVAEGHYISQPLWLVCALIVAAATLGDQVGYTIGKSCGTKLFNRPNSRLFKRENMDKAHAFMEKHGPKAIVFARFLPIGRTIAPILAGAGAMRYRTFLAYNLLGATLWGAGMTIAGYLLGQITFIASNVDVILALMLLVSAAPVVVKMIRARGKSRDTATAQQRGADESSADDSRHDASP
ncbi:DedA family protein [Streptomyces klenkii]|uniref:DedA family protein n=1 Tax=Streptomyces klenkii TaxID=1420899 RepID=UPI003F4DC413